MIKTPYTRAKDLINEFNYYFQANYDYDIKFNIQREFNISEKEAEYVYYLAKRHIHNKES